jgi:hypothetical protein
MVKPSDGYFYDGVKLNFYTFVQFLCQFLVGLLFFINVKAELPNQWEDSWAYWPKEWLSFLKNG